MINFNVIDTTKREYYDKALAAHDLERQSFMTRWKTITDHLLPHAGRYMVEDRNKGINRESNIVDSTATKSLQVLGAGMMAGMSSPARTWFRLGTPDSELAKFPPVKKWLNDVARIMRVMFDRSNVYGSLHQLYEELGAFGTACSLINEDFQDVMRMYPSTVGQFYIGQNDRQVIDTLYRKFQMQVGAMAQEFGPESLSKSTRGQFDQGNYTKWATVCHAIEPNRQRDVKSLSARDMEFRSVYWEYGQTEKKFLRESGFPMFPALCPRWHVAGGDIYGDGPGGMVLGDIQQLMHDHDLWDEAKEYMVKPPLVVPSNMKGTSSFLPGAVSFDPGNNANNSVKSAFDVQLDMNAVVASIEDIRQRIHQGFFTDLFQMLALSDRKQVTATEVAERHEEKLLVLGPVLERNQNELHDPLIDNAFVYGLEAGIFPPVPDEMRGREITVKYVSMLAQAQRAISIGSLDRVLGVVGAMQPLYPNITDKLRADDIMDEYADILGIDPDLVVSNEDLVFIRNKRQAIINKNLQREALPQAAATAKTLSETNTESQSALTDVAEQLSPA